MASDPAPAPTTVVRRARPADLPAVLGLERSSFTVPWTDRAFRMVMVRPDASLLVADRAEEVVGHAALWMQGREAELGDLAVAAAHRRRGIGTALLEAAVEDARKRGADRIYLLVRESNEAARELYRSAGFRRVGREHDYYRSPREDALVLSRDLAP